MNTSNRAKSKLVDQIEYIKVRVCLAATRSFVAEMHPVACRAAWGSCRTIIALSNVIAEWYALDNQGHRLHVGNRASSEQVDIHEVPIDRVPHVRGERAPEVAHQTIHLNERRGRPWVQHPRIRRLAWVIGGRSVVHVFCKVPSTESEVKIFDLREDDRGLDHQNERIGLTLGVSEQDLRVVEPLPFFGKYEHLSPMG